MPELQDHIRVDKLLWCVRLFKTRGMAATACKGGKVKIDGHTIKPSKELRAGDVFTLQSGIISRIFKVDTIPQSRVGAKLANAFVTDLTPAEEYEMQKAHAEFSKQLRPKGLGRPTKKERRKIDGLSADI